MGTLKVSEVVPSPTQDSERIRKAVQEGFGTDEEGLIWILGHRNASQRRKIRDTYQQLYNQCLIDRLDSELSGDFRKAMILWTYDPPERDAKLANEALKAKKKKGVDHLKIIVEMTCAMSPDHLMAVRQAYCSLFQCSLEEDIEFYVDSPPLRKLLAGLVRSYRYDRVLVDQDLANSEAGRLRECIDTKQLDSDHVMWILATRNVFQLRETFVCYKEKYGNSITSDVKNCGINGNLEYLLPLVISCIGSPEEHFAEVIRAAISGFGTDEDSLTRAIVSRAEIDMTNIKNAYSVMNKSSLDKDVADDISGDYKSLLMTLLGARF